MAQISDSSLDTAAQLTSLDTEEQAGEEEKARCRRARNPYFDKTLLPKPVHFGMELPPQGSRTHSRPIRFEPPVQSYLSGMCGRGFELVRPDSLRMEGVPKSAKTSSNARMHMLRYHKTHPFSAEAATKRKSKVTRRVEAHDANSTTEYLRMTILQLRRTKT
ncbi:hypothetical protein GQ600_19874 [Phytophthora cactorum]|nr:hypothetical protein GQ600_19874 [Phytophthora cactorum]